MSNSVHLIIWCSCSFISITFNILIYNKMDFLKKQQRHIWKRNSLVIHVLYAYILPSPATLYMFKKTDETLIEYIFADVFTI